MSNNAGVSTLTENQILNYAESMDFNEGYVDVIKLARLVGTDVIMVDADKGFGATIKHNGDEKFEIYVNANDPVVRQRFSIAHELAHLVLHKDVVKEKGEVGRLNLNSISSNLEEQADKLAAKVLMPEKSLRKFITDFIEKDPSMTIEDFVSLVSTKYNVSKLTAVMRLRDLNYHIPYLVF